MKHWPNSGTQEVPLRCYLTGPERIDKASWLKPDEVGASAWRSHRQRRRVAYGPIAQHFRPRRHRFVAAVYRQEMRHRFDTWQDRTTFPTAA
jgi:hypothetical protein